MATDFFVGMGAGLIGIPQTGGSFTMPVPPAPATFSKPRLKPEWTAVGWTCDPYRMPCPIEVENIPWYANGFDQPWLEIVASGTKLDLGCDALGQGEHAANTVTPALAAGAWLADGETAKYFYTLRDPTLLRESAPQLAEIANASGMTKSVDHTWTTTGLAAPWTKLRIWKQLRGAEGYKLVAEVDSSAGTYSDTTTYDDLEDNESPTLRERLTRPPKFVTWASYRGRVYAADGKSARVYVGQLADPLNGEYRQDDFGTFVDVKPGDGFGNVTAFCEHQGLLLIFKERAVYSLNGDDPETAAIEQLVGAPGCVFWRTLVRIRAFFSYLAPEGLILWTPGGDPEFAGSDGTSVFSPLQPIWARMNLGAAWMFSSEWNEATGHVELEIAVDRFPIPNMRLAYSTSDGRWWVDPDTYRTAMGVLEDAGGGLHLVGGNDLGDTMEEYVGNSDLVYAGETVLQVASATTLKLVMAGPPFFDPTDAASSPMMRFSAADGSLLDTNRVASIVLDEVHPLYAWTDDAVVDDVVAVGVIPYVVELPPHTARVPENKDYARAWFTFELQDEGVTARCDFHADDDDWELAEEHDLSEPRALEIVLRTSGESLSLRISQPYAGMDIGLLSYTIDFDLVGWGGSG